MKTVVSQKPVSQQKDRTGLYFNIFMGLLALGFIYMISLLFII